MAVSFGDSDSEQPHYIYGESITAWLTYKPLEAAAVLKSVRSPKAGATVLFAGTTRDNFNGKAVAQLQYSAYIPRALKTMLSIAESVKATHALTAVCIVHRLGVCPIGDESILIAVSAPHRQAAWRGGEQLLEECKEKVEVWKMEEFVGDDEGVWRANRDASTGNEETKVIK